MSEAINKILNEIVKVSNTLDQKGYIKFADALDEVVTNVVTIKKAQYHGVQGPHIKNDRCFQNCFRQKRAKDGLNTQESWEACHSEWLKANEVHDDTDWAKYADDNSFYNLEKVASADDHFEQEYKEQASELMAMALDLSERGEKEAAEKLSSAADELVKEAGWWDNVQQFARGFNEDVKLATQIRDKTVADLSSYLGQFRAAKGADTLNDANATKYVKGVAKYLYGVVRQLNQYQSESKGYGQTALSRLNANIQSVMQGLYSVKDLQSLEGQLDQGISLLSGMNMKDVQNLDYIGDQADLDQDGVADAQEQQTAPAQPQQQATEPATGELADGDEMRIERYLNNPQARAALLRELGLEDLGAVAESEEVIKEAQQGGLFEEHAKVGDLVSKYERAGRLDVLKEHVRGKIQPQTQHGYTSQNQGAPNAEAEISNALNQLSKSLRQHSANKDGQHYVNQALKGFGLSDGAAWELTQKLLGGVQAKNELENYFKLG